MNFQEKAQDFLAQKRIALVGASASKQATGNSILKSLRSQGYEVIPVHPSADSIEGETAYRRLQDIPNGVDALFLVASPDVVAQVVQDCPSAGIKRVWMHDNPLFGSGTSSFSAEALAFCQAHDIMVIEGGCPLMFLDFPHKCMRTVLGWMKKLPA